MKMTIRTGTASDHVFPGLPNPVPGDSVILTDENGETYAYSVTEIMEVPRPTCG